MTTRIFYSDGIDTGAQRGVQAIVQPDIKVSWYTESHGNYYLFKDDDLWHAADFDGLFTELKKRELIRPVVGTEHLVMYDGEWVKVNEIGFHEWLDMLDWVLCGETLDNKRFQEIFQHALADADYGRKYGYLSGEYKP